MSRSLPVVVGCALNPLYPGGIVHRFIAPSSPPVAISGSDGLPPPVKMTDLTTSRWPRSANRTLNCPSSPLVLPSLLDDESSRTSCDPSLCLLRESELFLRCDPGPLVGDFRDILLALGKGSVSPLCGGRYSGGGSSDRGFGGSSKSQPSESGISGSSDIRECSSSSREGT